MKVCHVFYVGTLWRPPFKSGNNLTLRDTSMYLEVTNINNLMTEDQVTRRA